MSDTLHPPLRISITSSASITQKIEQVHLDAFLDDYAQRMATMGGDTTITSQLYELKAALEDNRQADENGECHCRVNAMSLAN